MLGFTTGTHFDTETALLGIPPKESVRDDQRLQDKNMHHSEDMENT